MRHYELVTILSPMLSQDQATEAWGQINDFITNREGDIFQEQPWGTRRLAYPIHQGSYHFLEGNYRLIRFSTERPFNQALENFLKFDERVLRSLVISIPDREILPDPVAARPAPAAATATPAEGGAESSAEATSETATEAAAEATPEAAQAPAAEAEEAPAAEAVTEEETPAAQAEETPSSEAAEAPAAEAEEAPVAEATPEAAEAVTEEEAPTAEAEEAPAAEAETPAETSDAPAEEESQA